MTATLTMSTLTVPSPGPSLGSPIPSSPTGISPTYDLLGQYAEGRSPVALEPEPVHEHHAVWRQISETHENLLEQRRKDKVDPGMYFLCLWGLGVSKVSFRVRQATEQDARAIRGTRERVECIEQPELVCDLSAEYLHQHFIVL